MTPRYSFLAYLATLAALVLVFIAALIAGAINGAVIGKIEAFGLGTITGGLIGVLRLPSLRPGAHDDTLSPPKDMFP